MQHRKREKHENAEALTKITQYFDPTDEDVKPTKRFPFMSGKQFEALKLIDIKDLNPGNKRLSGSKDAPPRKKRKSKQKNLLIPKMKKKTMSQKKFRKTHHFFLTIRKIPKEKLIK